MLKHNWINLFLVFLGQTVITNSWFYEALCGLGANNDQRQLILYFFGWSGASIDKKKQLIL